MEKQTSRHHILDMVECIGQLLALNSHLQEIVDSYGHNDKVSNDDVSVCMDMIAVNNQIRRDYMEAMKTSLSDHKRWCCVKHSIFAYELSCEILYAENGLINKINQEKCAQNMYIILSKFLSYPTVMCGRCLQDQLNNNKPIQTETKDTIHVL